MFPMARHADDHRIVSMSVIDFDSFRESVVGFDSFRESVVGFDSFRLFVLERPNI
jgi:hypothetical protein